MNRRNRGRRVILGLVLLAIAGFILIKNYDFNLKDLVAHVENPSATISPPQPSIAVPNLATDALSKLEVKGRAPKTGYTRSQFGDGWARQGDCDMRNIILNRDLQNPVVNSKCKVESGVLQDPYTGTTVQFSRGAQTSDKVQIDHVVALSDAWQKGAQNLTPERRQELANDPLELLAVDGQANQQKSDGDAATWLPHFKPFRCQYVARQIAIKQKYTLWVTEAEKDAIAGVLETCPNQLLPVSTLAK